MEQQQARKFGYLVAKRNSRGVPTSFSIPFTPSCFFGAWPPSALPHLCFIAKHFAWCLARSRGVPTTFYNRTMMFSTNRGTPHYYSLLNRIDAVAQMRLDNADLRKGTHKSFIQELPVSIPKIVWYKMIQAPAQRICKDPLGRKQPPTLCK